MLAAVSICTFKTSKERKGVTSNAILVTEEGIGGKMTLRLLIWWRKLYKWPKSDAHSEPARDDT